MSSPFVPSSLLNLYLAKEVAIGIRAKICTGVELSVLTIESVIVLGLDRYIGTAIEFEMELRLTEAMLRSELRSLTLTKMEGDNKK